MLTGMVSIDFIKEIELGSIPFLSTYLIILTDVILLSKLLCYSYLLQDLLRLLLTDLNRPVAPE